MFEKDFLKPINSSVFGKAMENIRKLLISWEKYTSYVMKPKFKDEYPFS